MAKDYYFVLGIDRCADPGQIKHAYRRIAKQFHPDRCIPSADAERFMEVKEAYDTLVDVERRRRYDDELTRRESSAPAPQVRAIIRDRSRLYHEWAQRESLVDEFFAGWVPGLGTSNRRRGFEKDLFVEVVLSPRESRQGGLFPINFPVVEACPRCHDGGIIERFFCPVCEGRGGVRTEREFSLAIPPRTADGTSVTLSLEDIGLSGARLNVEVRVDPSLMD